MPDWQLNALAELIGEIGVRKFPGAFLGNDAPARGHAGAASGTEPTPEITEKTKAKALRLLAALAEDDLTLNQAADRLCISVPTANQHIAAARQVFGVETTAGAVFAAMQQGLIEG